MLKRFSIIEMIGQGGHGTVYRARDEQLQRIVAVKVFHNNQSEGARLIKEAQTISQLTHPGIVSVYDVSRVSLSAQDEMTITLSEHDPSTDDSVVWAIIMEDLGDTEFLDYVNQHGPDEGLRLIADIADALHWAHVNGIIHCDIKSSNVHIVRGQAKVFDFSLAAREKGRPYGTPAYRAPEQSRGEEPSDRTDVYGLGHLLRRLHMGVRAKETITSRLYGPRIRLMTAEERVEQLIQCMLDPNPQKRPNMSHVAKVCRASIRVRRSWRYIAALALVTLASSACIIGAEIILKRAYYRLNIDSRNNITSSELTETEQQRLLYKSKVYLIPREPRTSVNRQSIKDARARPVATQRKREATVYYDG